MVTCLDTMDWLGNRVVFYEKNRAIHADKHPELRLKGFIECVKQAIENPHFVYEDFEHPGKRIACYVKEYEHYKLPHYTKVVITITGKVREVVTAFDAPSIKEKIRKCKLIYGKPN